MRPGFGTQGRRIFLWANYMELSLPDPPSLHRYHIEIKDIARNQVVTGKRAQRSVELLIGEHFNQQGPNIVTDFRQYVYSSTRLDISRQPFDVRIRQRGEDVPSLNAKRHRIRLTYQGSQSVASLIDYLTSSNASALLANKEALIQALGFIVSHNCKASSQVASIGANRHHMISPAENEVISLSAGLEAVRGFFLSVRAATGRILLNVQPKHSPFYVAGSLEGLMHAFAKENGRNRKKLHVFLKLLAVNATHLVNRNKAGEQIPRVKTIIGLATERDGQNLPNPPIIRRMGAGPKEVQFWLEESSQGRYVTVYEFFQRRYNLTIVNTELPVVNVGNQAEPVYLPAQVCQVIKGQPYRGRLSPNQTQQMISFAVRKPRANARSIVNEGYQMINMEQASNPTLDAFGVDIQNRLITVPGRVLTSPSILYGSNKSISPTDGSWNMANTRLNRTQTLESWACLQITTPTNRGPGATPEQLKGCLARFATQLRNLGVRCDTIPSQNAVEIDPSEPGNIDTVVSETFHRLASKPNPPRLVLVILPSDLPEIYNRVKYVGDIQEGMVNVCVLASKFAKANPQYFANVGLKVNLKLGGLANQKLEESKLGLIAQGKTMLVGLDVTHPSPTSTTDAPSIVGIVASVDAWLGQWPAELMLQTGRKEMVSALTSLMKSRLALWKKHNQEALPDNIIVYRDGVSEGQYNTVLNEELPRIKAACAEMYPADRTKAGFPRLAIIVVGKRHHTRFYPTREEDADRSTNPKSGTVVDRGVTEARNWDFFMQAHAAIQGTARPAHYYVVYDEIFRSYHDYQKKTGLKTVFANAADALEDFTFNLCFLFGRATKAVSICPPAYYADLVCDRARRWMSEFYDQDNASSRNSNARGPDSRMITLHPRVANTMFYL